MVDRELTGGIYFGERKKAEDGEAHGHRIQKSIQLKKSRE